MHPIHTSLLSPKERTPTPRWHQGLYTLGWYGLFVLGLLAVFLPAVRTQAGWMVPALALLGSLLVTGKNSVWLGAKLGLLLWGTGEGLATLEARGLQLGHASDVLFTLGYVPWCWTFLKLHGRSRPSTVLLLTCPLVGAILYFTLLQPDPNYAMAYPLLDCLLLFCAAPATQAFMEGRTSPGRAVWVVSLYTFVAVDLVYALQRQSGTWDTLSLDNLTYGMIYGALAFGAYLEQHYRKGGTAPVLAAVFILLSIRHLVNLQSQPDVSGTVLNLIFFYLTFLATGGVIVALRNHQKLTQQQFVAYHDALMSVLEAQEQQLGDQARLEQVVQNVYQHFQQVLPELQGLQLDGSTTLKLGESSPLKREEAIYTEGLVTTRVVLYFAAPPLQAPAVDAVMHAVRSVVGFTARHQAMREQLVTDPLTGVLNKRALHGVLQRFEGLSSRNQQTVALCMLDLDNFKRINDQHGHQVGDEVLKLTATLIRKQLRAEDEVIRWGGEEFMVLLYNCTPEQAAVTLGRIRQKLRLFSQDRVGFAVSFSGGVAGGVVQLSGDLQRWSITADMRLLKAKARGKNQVVLLD